MINMKSKEFVENTIYFNSANDYSIRRFISLLENNM